MAALTAIGGVATSCGAKELRVPTVDSGAWASTNYVPGSVYWVDDDRVLFLGASDEQLASRCVPRTKLVLKLLHVSSGSIDEIERDVFGCCYAEGRLVVSFKQGRRVLYEPRTLEEAAPDQRFEIGEALVIDPLNCGFYGASSAPGVEQGRHWKPLRDGDGVLDYGERSGKGGMPPITNLQHRSPDGSSTTPLDLKNEQVDQLAYVPFRGEYFLYKLLGGGGARALDEDHCVLPAHWFSPGRAVRHVEIPIPCSLLEGAGISVFPTRVGYLLRFSGGAPLGGRSPTQGLHLTGGERAGRVLPGFVGDLAVSPDGCKVAAVHADSIRAKRDFRSTLKVLDLCALEGQP